LTCQKTRHEQSGFFPIAALSNFHFNRNRSEVQKRAEKRSRIMSLTIGSLMIVTGLAIAWFGLFLFYAWLPLLYALVGLDIGILLGRTLTGAVGTTAIVFGIAGAVILGATSYLLEPYRRILLGVSGGILFGLSAAAVFGFDGWLGGFFSRILALVCGVIGGLLVPRVFDWFVIAATAFSGAALVVAGVGHVLPGIGTLDRVAGGVLPPLLTIALAVAAMSWQSHNSARWIQMLPTRGGLDTPARDQTGARQP
jgi:uncharacterized protein DUF4203